MNLVPIYETNFLAFPHELRANVPCTETEFCVRDAVNTPSKSAGKGLAVARAAVTRTAKSSAEAAPVGVISKVFRILEALQGSSAGLGLKAICDLTGIHKEHRAPISETSRA